MYYSCFFCPFKKMWLQETSWSAWFAFVAFLDHAALKHSSQGSSPCCLGVRVSPLVMLLIALFFLSQTHPLSHNSIFFGVISSPRFWLVDSCPDFGAQLWAPTLGFNNLPDFPHVDSPALVSNLLLLFAPTPIPLPFVLSEGPCSHLQNHGDPLTLGYYPAHRWLSLCVRSHMLLDSLGFI